MGVTNPEITDITALAGFICRAIVHMQETMYICHIGQTFDLYCETRKPLVLLCYKYVIVICHVF